MNYWNNSYYPVWRKLNTLIDNCSDIFRLYNGASYVRYSISLNVPHKDSIMHSLLKEHLIDKLTIRIKDDDSYLGGDPDENSANLTYTVNDKWSLPFNIFCLDSNCKEYYNNKYPVLIEPTAYLCLIPYDYMDLLKISTIVMNSKMENAIINI